MQNGGDIKPVEGPMSEEDRMKADLLDIKVQMNAKTDESLESTRRMVQLAEEAKEAGIGTLVMLDEQGEQLEAIEKGLNTINTDMKTAENALRDLEKCCGLCVLPWQRTSNPEKGGDYAATWKQNDDGAVNADGPRVVVGEQAFVGGGYVTKITNDGREEEMEENVANVASMVGNLRNMAVDMGTEINAQNRLLDRAQQKAQSNEGRISEANKRATKILKTV